MFKIKPIIGVQYFFGKGGSKSQPTPEEPAVDPVVVDPVIDENAILDDALVLEGIPIDAKQVDAIGQLLSLSSAANLKPRISQLIFSKVDFVFNYRFEDDKSGQPNYENFKIKKNILYYKVGGVEEKRGCDLARMPATPTLEELESSPHCIYIISDVRILYYDRYHKTLDEIKVSPLDRKKVENKFKDLQGLKLLSASEIKELSRIITHCHQDSVIKKFLTYQVIAPKGNIVSGTFTHELLSAMGYNSKHYTPLDLKPYLPQFLEITHARGHTAPREGYNRFLSLAQGPKMAAVTSLSLEACKLDNDKAYDIVSALAKQRHLKALNLDRNYLNKPGLATVLNILFQDCDSQIEEFSLRYNNMVIDTLEQLRDVGKAVPSTAALKKLHLEGNMILDNRPHLRKNRHSKREALIMFFCLLATSDYDLTIGQFLSTKFLSLTLCEEELFTYLLILHHPDGFPLILGLSKRDYECYYELHFETSELTGKREENKNATNASVYGDLIAGFGSSPTEIIPPSVLACKLRQEASTYPQAKALAKRLLSYHEQLAPLKSYLNQHSFFSSRRIEITPSLLFRENTVTLEEGWVYLIANKSKGILDEHALIGYEFLTSNGQHIFKVAHLTHNSKAAKEEQTKIEIVEENAALSAAYYTTSKHIAAFPASTKHLKAMDSAIIQDTKQFPKNTGYQFMISGTSRRENITNCLTYCLDKMKTHLDLDLGLGAMDFRPSTFVVNLSHQQQEKGYQPR